MQQPPMGGAPAGAPESESPVAESQEHGGGGGQATQLVSQIYSGLSKLQQMIAHSGDEGAAQKAGALLQGFEALVDELGAAPGGQSPSPAPGGGGPVPAMAGHGDVKQAL
jgi:hypothetical protein